MSSESSTPRAPLPLTPEADPLFAAILATFAKRGWESEAVEGRLVANCVFEAHHTRVPVHVQSFPEIGAMQAVGYSGHRVPTARMGVVSELLMRCNQQLTVGNFELDYDAGRVFFRTTNIFPLGGPYADSIILGLVHTCIVEMDRLCPLLTEILNMEPAQLAQLNLRLFVQREDHLPPISDETATA